MSAKHCDNHLHIPDLISPHNNPTREIFYPHFAGNETEAEGRSALTRPAGGAPLGMSASSLWGVKIPAAATKELQGRYSLNSLYLQKMVAI